MKIIPFRHYRLKCEALLEGERLLEKRFELLDAALRRGLADIDAGRTHALEDIADELSRRDGSALAVNPLIEKSEQR